MIRAGVGNYYDSDGSGGLHATTQSWAVIWKFLMSGIEVSVVLNLI
jgi:hypothetical protein